MEEFNIDYIESTLVNCYLDTKGTAYFSLHKYLPDDTFYKLVNKLIKAGFIVNVEPGGGFEPKRIKANRKDGEKIGFKSGLQDLKKHEAAESKLKKEINKIVGSILKGSQKRQVKEAHYAGKMFGFIMQD